VIPLDALTGRRLDVKVLRVWGRRAWALKPKQQERDWNPGMTPSVFSFKLSVERPTTS